MTLSFSSNFGIYSSDDFVILAAILGIYSNQNELCSSVVYALSRQLLIVVFEFDITRKAPE